MKPNGDGVCVVGDDAQAIYSFRAATVDNILDFPGRFTPPAQIVKLEQNYRSVQPILDAANVLMSDSAAAVSEGAALGSARRVSKPSYVAVQDDQAQALYVVEQILAAREQGTLLRTAGRAGAQLRITATCSSSSCSAATFRT